MSSYLILMSLLWLTVLAKHRGGSRRRKYRKYLPGQIDIDFALGTLGVESLAKMNVPDTLTEKAWLSSVKCSWTMINFTKQTTDGPILVGIAHSDYTAAEIESWIENLNSWDSGDLLAQEIAKRKIRYVGQFQSPATVQEVARINDGRQFRTKANWQLETGDTVAVWAYNQGSSPLAGTDPVVHVSGKANLWPN